MRDVVTDINRSIEQLEDDAWKDVEFPTPLVEKVYRYRKIPLKQLSIEQLRLLVGQNVGLKFLVPHALAILSQDVLAEGEHYEGDLLSAVLSAEDNYWANNKSIKILLQSKIPAWTAYLESRNENNTHIQLLKALALFELK